MTRETKEVAIRGLAHLSLKLILSQGIESLKLVLNQKGEGIDILTNSQIDKSSKNNRAYKNEFYQQTSLSIFKKIVNDYNN